MNAPIVRRALSEPFENPQGKLRELVRPLLAFIPPNLAGPGVNGFGDFCRNKSHSAVGPRPDTHKQDMQIVN